MSQKFYGQAEITTEMLRTMPAGAALHFPPPAFSKLGAEFTEYTPGGTLGGSFPADPGFANPMGVFLGAATVAALDVLFGALSFMETREACTTVTLETQFIRPIIADGERFHAEVRIRARTRRMVFMEGQAFTQGNKLAATATTTMMILSSVNPES